VWKSDPQEPRPPRFPPRWRARPESPAGPNMLQGFVDVVLHFFAEALLSPKKDQLKEAEHIERRHGRGRHADSPDRSDAPEGAGDKEPAKREFRP